jgi:hypothetical protein
MPTAKEETNEPGYVALLALEALARYSASGLAHDGEKMYKDLAVRCARVVDKDSWT